MGLFSRKPSDSKARIEELKKKIQAEQAAFVAEQSAPTQPAPPVAPQAPVAPAPVPPPAFTQPAPLPPVPQPAYQQPAPRPPQPAYQPPAPVYEDYAPAHRRQHRQEEVEEDEEELQTGIILDLGEGMSLNLPIRAHMRLDEFMHIAERVRELQRLAHSSR
jgi:hypothetical protein